MKIIVMGLILCCLAASSWGAEASVTILNGQLLTEDTTWSGTVLVRGSVVVAPQATLRIAPGAVVRFAATTGQLRPSLVVQGRLHVAGTQERPITIGAEQTNAVRGSWGGIVLLSTEKRNSIEQCRIESADTAVDLRFSHITLKSTTIAQSTTALTGHDAVLHLSDCTISDCDTGMDLTTSEVDGKNVTISTCRNGYIAHKSAIGLSGAKVFNCQQTGFESHESRIKISGGEFVGNLTGARLNGGEGQITLCRFQGNRQLALHLSGARVKVLRCLFTGNSQDALRTDDGLALILNNSFSSNGGFNLFNAGRELVAAWQNWWDSTDPVHIGKKIHDAAQDNSVAAVAITPWLSEKPMLMPY